MMHHTCRLALIVAVTGVAMLGCVATRSADTGAPLGMAVKAVSQRSGLLFTDSEPVDVRARVTGAQTAATVEYTVSDMAPTAPNGGPAWHVEGKLSLPAPVNGLAEGPLPLKLPGRGLYHLQLTATAGGQSAKSETWVAVVFTPAKPDPASPWAIFYAPPEWFDPANPNGAQDAALSHRLLGASWTRLNFWAGSFGKVTVTQGDKPTVTYDKTQWMRYATALRKEGINIMGEIAQCPRELSSRPNDEATAGDAGPIYNRVKPASYELWGQLMAQVAADFRDEIPVWEVWNEANLQDGYWVGTPEDFYELVKQTAAGLRRGNPKARIAAAGFVHGHAFADKLFQLGLGKEIDILSVHYTDETPSDITGYQALLAKYGLKLPIWNSEERSEVPLHNLASPIERSFKFIHVAVGYPDFRPLVRQDYTVQPAGVLFSVGAHCIGAAKFVALSDKTPGCETFLFRRGAEMIAAVESRGLPALFGGAATVVLQVEPLRLGVAPTATDTWGRSRPLRIERGQVIVPLTDRLVFVNGCRTVQVTETQPSRTGAGLIFEAESGKWSGGWSANPRDGFSGGKILELWAPAAPEPDGFWAEVGLDVPADGRYEVIFSGNGLSRLAKPRSLSPFVWTIDGGPEHVADDALPPVAEATGMPESPSILGQVDLTRGKHTFRLKLTGPRDQPDHNYALWFDAIVLRPVKG
jgi:hypothetical protein